VILWIFGSEDQRTKPRQGDPRQSVKAARKKTPGSRKRTQEIVASSIRAPHNTSECQTKKLLVAELKASEFDACSDLEPEPNKGNGKGKQIIDSDPSTTISTTKIQNK